MHITIKGIMYMCQNRNIDERERRRERERERERETERERVQCNNTFYKPIKFNIKG